MPLGQPKVTRTRQRPGGRSSLRLPTLAGVVFLGLCAPAFAQQDPAGLARPGSARIPDRFTPLPPAAVRFESGLLGDRVAANARVRLLRVDEDDLLDAFERRSVPHHAWQGEHAGKFLHAATLAWAATKDPALKSKIDRVARRLVATQEADGYLGTYPPEQRWTGWDVWVHKYDLLGLLTYHQYTRDAAVLSACRRVGELLETTFGPGRRDINTAGEHVGMAATSVLEPMVLLHRATGDPRHLAFARYIVANYDAPGGPAILSSLEQHGTVDRVANGKAYEMLSNLNGLVELYRVTGDARYLKAARAAWKDVATRRLYVTGTASSGEHFHGDGVLPNGESANVGETCVTVTWLQMNMHLLRLTGEARFADEIERAALNHLMGAQKPSGGQWCYYTPLEGRKPYGDATNCCLSSGPRGMALLPVFAAMATRDGGLAVNLYNAGTTRATLPSGPVRLAIQTQYPLHGDIRLAVHPARSGARFPLLLRIPAWAEGATLSVNGQSVANVRPGAYTTIQRNWQRGDTVRLVLPMRARLVRGTHGNAGKAAIVRGPLVLALDEGLNPGLRLLKQAELASDAAGLPMRFVGMAKGRMVFATRGRSGSGRTPALLHMTPFATAGQDGRSPYAVWIARPGHADTSPTSGSLLYGGMVRVSRRGNVEGDIADDYFSTFRVTFDGRAAEEDWYAVSLRAPARIRRVVFAHGRVFHDGGWFDASEGKPRIEVREMPEGPWKTVATLNDYPPTTATDAAGLTDGQRFAVDFAPVTAAAVRVVGTPASGDNPAQAFSSCAELQAFGP